jgi:hypothetical protein
MISVAYSVWHSVEVSVTVVPLIGQLLQRVDPIGSYCFRSRPREETLKEWPRILIDLPGAVYTEVTVKSRVDVSYKIVVVPVSERY